MNLGRFSSYRVAEAVSPVVVRERTVELRHRVGSRITGVTATINDFPTRLRDVKFLLRIGVGIGALILLVAVFTASSSPVAPARPSLFSSPTSVQTTPTTAPTTTAATATTIHRSVSLPAQRAAVSHPKAPALATHASRVRTSTAAMAAPHTSPAAAAPVVNTVTVPSPGRTTTTVQTVTVTSPASPTPAPSPTQTTTAPTSTTPPPGTMTEASFKGLAVNQITRGVITSVFGTAATAKQLQSSLGSAWVKAAAKDLPSGTSCVYYFDRDGKAQTFQLCFDSSNMLVRKQSLTDSTASGSA